jgi:hypothetical protein
MHVYGSQLAPLLEALVTAGGLDGIGPTGKFHERALWRGSLRGWYASGEASRQLIDSSSGSGHETAATSPPPKSLGGGTNSARV